MRSFFGLTPSVPLALAIAFSACGGNVSEHGEQGGTPGVGQNETGGANTGGRGAISTGGLVSSGGVPATGGAGPTEGGCCNLLACPNGDQLLMGSSCPAGWECYAHQSCCTQVMCGRRSATCTALPTCDPGDRAIMGECPPSPTCYSRTLCDTTIHCVSESGVGGEGGAGGAACDPAAEYNRKYAATDLRTCTLIDFACPETVRMFQNDCGCGCEQPATCPRFVDCAPRVDTRPMDPLCGDSAACPYTVRAY